ncbi:hypothetical protein AVEN_167335-1 [Araneus ventricosus]|uniref:Uncharacterized protein n=1 Tax=Araneus ventricosus TaxID=182803 RepID=A0A4Y2DEG2_ARAVE|nr:hypothetical protein AVEN_167335-1 [Araneus ventricosus]
MSIPHNASLVVGNRHILRFLLDIGDWKSMTPTLATKLTIILAINEGLMNTRIFLPSLLREKLWRFFWNVPVMSHLAGKGYKYSEVLKDFNRLWSANGFGITSESCSHCELVNY